MKKFITLLLILAMVLPMAACGSESDEPAPAFKIGIITGTAVQSKEEYQAAQRLKEKYGNMIVAVTYPDNFTSETDKMVNMAVKLAEDPDVKAIIWVQAVEGSVEAMNRIREKRDDLLLIGGITTETPAAVAQAFDVVMVTNELQLGADIVGQAAKQGAKTFVHISFDRHLEIEAVAQRRGKIEQRCNVLGMEYVDAFAPDPVGPKGVEEVKEWVEENIPVYVDLYGKDTAFFSTNCAMQAPLIRQVAKQGAIFPLECCPSPFHAYPDAFGIDLAGHENDSKYVLDEIKKNVEEYNNSGRMSTWSVPMATMIIEGGAEYAIKWCKGEVTQRLDEDALLSELRKIGGGEVSWSSYEDSTAGVLKNYKMIEAPLYDF